MKEHFKKYGIIYQIIIIVICLILSCIFIYLGRKNRKEHHYTEEEATNIMKLKADQLTRMIEINSKEDTCTNSSTTTLSEEDMEKYGFDKDFYQTITYTMICEDEKQIVKVSITGIGDFKGYQITDYISNQS